MDRALWLLLGLRFKSWLRRFGRSLRSPKGAVLTLVGLGVLVLWIAPHLVLRRPTGPAHLEAVRRFGPLILLLYCLATLLFSAGERAIYFSPGEVNFLFTGPFHRRQLLLYKVVASLGLGSLSAAVMTLVMKDHQAWTLAAYVGMFLMLMFVQFFMMAVALVTACVGALATSWRRRLVLAGLVTLAATALWQSGKDVLVLSNLELLARMEQSPVFQAVLTPFRWFILTFTAEQLWPDFVQWTALSLSINLVLLALVLGLDAHYLETAAASSARIYARIEQLRRGGTAGSLRGSGKARFGLPLLPWWGGAGPVAWRQLTAASRDFGRLVLAVIIFGVMAFPLVVGSQRGALKPEMTLIFEAFTIGMALFLTQIIPFDFRADIDRIAELKVLPIAPWALAVGQMIAPVVLMTALQWAVLATSAAYSERLPDHYWSVASFALPFNVLLFGVENAVFLWFPTRLVSTNPGDIQAIGRVILLMFAKACCVALAGVVAVLPAVVAYFLTGGNWAVMLAVGWIALAGLALGLVPIVALAFCAFDVARDTPP